MQIPQCSILYFFLLFLGLVCPGTTPGQIIPRLIGQWPGYPHGPSWSVQVVDHYAYVAQGRGGLAIYDIQDPAHLVWVGGYDTGIIPCPQVQVVGPRAYLVVQPSSSGNGPNSLFILDVSDPTNVRKLGQVTVSPSPFAVQLVGTMAYVARREYNFEIYDLSDPGHVQFVGSFDGHYGSVQVVGTLAYGMDGPSGLQILDVSDPAHVRLLGSYIGENQDIGIGQVVGSTAYMTDDLGFQILDVSNPSNIRRLGAYEWGGRSLGIEIAGSIAYLRAIVEDYPIQILDVSDPANVRRLGSFDTQVDQRNDAIGGQPQIVGRLAYMANGIAGLQIFDISDPTQVRRLTSVYQPAGFALDVQVDGTIAYLSDYEGGLQLLDVSNPAEVRRLGGYNNLYAVGAQIAGPRAYVAALDRDLIFLDVSDPANVSWLGQMNFYAQTVLQTFSGQVVGNQAYLAGSGLGVFDIRDPANVVPLGVTGLPNTDTWAVQVVGTVAYLADSYGLDILEVSDPSEMQLLGRHIVGPGGFGTSMNDGFGRVQIAGTVAYVLGGSGFEVLDVSDPAQIQRLGSYPGVLVGDFQVVGTMVFVADSSTGLKILDISDPAHIQLLGSFTADEKINAVQVVGNLVYLAVGTRGLEILELPELGPPTIQQPPQRQTVAINSEVTFSVSATGPGPLSYQWIFNRSKLLKDAQTSTLSLTHVNPHDAGNYSVVVSNPHGSVTSQVATLTVTKPAAPSRRPAPRP